VRSSVRFQRLYPPLVMLTDVAHEAAPDDRYYQRNGDPPEHDSDNDLDVHDYSASCGAASDLSGLVP
jgi:hypothetical protein